MTITDLLKPLGPGVSITYLQREDTDQVWCEIQLPLDRFTVTLATEWGWDEDSAVQNTVERALTEFQREDVKGVAA